MFEFIENGINQTGSWFGIDTRTTGEKNAEALAQQQFQQEQYWNQKNYETQKDQFDKNFGFQVDKYEYDKALQQTIFNREDNSVQRRTQDLKQAGINPILAAGQGASAGAVVSTTAPQGEAAQHKGPADASALIDINMKKQGLMQMAMNTLKMKADIDHTKADTERILMSKDEFDWRQGNEDVKNTLARDRFDHDVRNSERNYNMEYFFKESDSNLRRSAQALHERQFEVDKILKEKRGEKIDSDIATSKLVDQGLTLDIAQKILDYDITARDALYSMDAAIRYKDSINPYERIGNSLVRSLKKDSTLVDQYDDIIKSRMRGERY